jgi:hypothetical protein
MNVLPFDPSESEDELIEQQLITPAGSPPATPSTSTNPFHPVWARLNEDSTTIPAGEITLVLATDIASSAFFIQALSKSPQPPCLTLTSAIQKPHKPHAAKSPNTTNSTTADKIAKLIVYSFFAIPNTDIVVGVTNVDVPSTYGNHIADHIFNPESSCLKSIKHLHIFNAQSFTTLPSSVQDMLHKNHLDPDTSTTKYPIFFRLTSQIAPVSPNPLNIPPYPSYMGSITGFAAAVTISATTRKIASTLTVSILNNQHLPELFASFERATRSYALQPAIPSIYGQHGDKLPRSVVSAALKATVQRFEQLYAEQQRILPHAKQSGLPAAVFL